MPINDFLLVVQWWLAFAIIGILFLPITSIIFSNFFDRGYIFAKILGVVLISYLALIFGMLHIASFTTTNIIVITAVTTIITLLPPAIRRYALFCSRDALQKLPIFVLEEFLFFLGILFWSYIRAHQPDIQGLEKFMDFGFVNSILRSEYFPPKDMWFIPFSINYYYFGHFYTAVATKLSGIDPAITYNFMIATLFSFTFTCAFSIGLNLFAYCKKENETQFLKLAIVAGFLCAFLVSLAGNLHTIYSFFASYNTDNPVPFWQLVFSPQAFPNGYWYPNATRFIYNTIHEFPIYSFVVSDLHGHVLDIPIVLTIIAILLHEFLKIKEQTGIATIFLISFLLAAAYMTNAWDGLIYLILTVTMLIFIQSRLKSINITEAIYTKYIKGLKLIKDQQRQFAIYKLLAFIGILGIGFFAFSFPFNVNFKPFVSGVGMLCAPEFLTNIGKIGPFLFEADHCQRSPLWQLFILYSSFYFFVLYFFYFLRAKKELVVTDAFVLTLIFLSTLLIFIPEIIYVKDIYPAHYRANTMFKLVYQSFIMLSLSCGYIIIRLISSIHRKNKIFSISYVYLPFTILFFIGVFIYPLFAIPSYYGNLKNYHGLHGLSYLNRLYPFDYQAIIWLNKNIQGQPVILEAQGDSYTDYARVSANTGLPTVLGWTVHEWLWRGSYDIPAPRISDIQNLYESADIVKTRALINKYNIQLVFIGDLERKKYTSLNQKKFNNLGSIIYQDGTTKIYKITE